MRSDIGTDEEANMSNGLSARIEALDDRQAIFVVKKLSEAVFTKIPPPSTDTMATGIDEASKRAGLEPALAQYPTWTTTTLQAAEGGRIARGVLQAWAQDAGLSPAVDKAIDQFKTAKQDFGILSVPVALGLSYALIAMDLDIDLGFVKLKKKGLSGAQQTDVVKKSVEPILKAIRTLSGS
jgi:hypothetical protein